MDNTYTNLRSALDIEISQRTAGDQASLNAVNGVQDQTAVVGSGLSTEVVQREAGDLRLQGLYATLGLDFSNLSTSTQSRITDLAVRMDLAEGDLATQVNLLMAAFTHTESVMEQAIANEADARYEQYTGLDNRVAKYEYMLGNITADSIQITADNDQINAGAWTILSQARKWDLEILALLENYRSGFNSSLDSALEDLQEQIANGDANAVSNAIEAISNAPIMQELDGLISGQANAIDGIKSRLQQEIDNRIAEAQATVIQMTELGESLSGTFWEALQGETTARLEAIAHEAQIRGAQFETLAGSILDELNERANDLQDETLALLDTIQDGLNTEIQERKDATESVITQINSYKVTNDLAVSTAVQRIQTLTDLTGSHTTKLDALQSQYNTADGKISGNTLAIQNLSTKVTQQGNLLVSQGESITTLTSGLANANAGITQNSNAISSLTTTSITNANLVSSHSTAITALQSDLENTRNALNTKASTTALNNLSTTVTQQGNKITAQTEQLTSLSAAFADDKTNLFSPNVWAALGNLGYLNDTGENTIANSGHVFSGFIPITTSTLSWAQSNVAQSDSSRTRAFAYSKDKVVLGRVIYSMSNASGVLTLPSDTAYIRISAPPARTLLILQNTADAQALSALDSKVTQQGSDITSQSGQLTSLNNSLTSLTGTVNKKADSSALSALDSKVSTIDGKVSTQSNQVTDLSNAITVTANKVDNLTVGGRNLLRYTGIPSNIVTAAGTNSTAATGYSLILGNVGAALNAVGAALGNTLRLSFDWEYVSTTSVPSGAFNLQFSGTPWSMDWGSPQIPVAAKKGHYSSGSIITDSALTSTASSLRLRMDNMQAGDTIILTNVMLEVASVESNWTPALEDISADIAATSNALNTLDSKVTQQGKDITSQSSNITALRNDLTSLNTTVNGKASASALSTLDSKVTQQGTTISSQGSSITGLTNRVTAVEGTANTAITNAASALTVANTGVTNAAAVSTGLSEFKASFGGAGTNLLPGPYSDPQEVPVMRLSGIYTPTLVKSDLRPQGKAYRFQLTTSTNTTGYTMWSDSATNIPLDYTGGNRSVIVSFWMRGDPGTAGHELQIYLRYGTEPTAGVTGAAGASLTVLLAETWTQYSFVASIANSYSYIGLAMRPNRTGVDKSGTVFYMDNLMIERQIAQGTTPSAFVAGSTAITQIIAGVREFSQSTADAQSATAANVTALTSRMGTVEGTAANALTTANTAVSKADANASSITSLDSRLDSLTSTVNTKASASALSTLDTKVTSIDGRVTSSASSITTLQTTVGQHTTKINDTSLALDGVEAVRTVSIDNNGVISGFGLISQLVNGQVNSAFGVNADYFYVGTPNNGKRPFMVLTKSQTINGTTYPAGTWIDVALIANATIGTAHIADASITNAKIKNLDASKITTGVLDAGRIRVGSTTQFDSGFAPSEVLNNAKSYTDAIEVGGRNLLIQSRLQAGYLQSGTGQPSGRAPDHHDPTYYPCVAGEKFIGRVTDFNGVTSLGGTGYICFYDSNKVNLANYPIIASTLGVVRTAVAPANTAYYRVATIAKGIKDKIEKGDKATDWTPAPEDVDTAIESKSKTFTAQPTTPYAAGDIYRNGSSIYVCTTGRSSGSYVASDWTLVGDVTANNKAADSNQLGGKSSATVFNDITAAKSAADTATANANTANNQLTLWKYPNTTYIDGGKIYANSVTANQIKVTRLDAISATLGTFKTADSGQRVEISDNGIRIYDSNNVARIELGNF